MITKLSNTAERKAIEREFELDFKYPDIYSPEIVINGAAEANIPIITSRNLSQIELGIWGLMPQDCKEDWEVFQGIQMSLSVTKNQIKKVSWIKKLFKSRRALLIVTGFFSHFYKNGELYPYYISLESGKPFLVGGVFSVLNDGFLSCAVITTTANKFISKFNNLSNQMPVIIPKEKAFDWILSKKTEKFYHSLIDKPANVKLRAYPVAKELFNNNIVYGSILQPVQYENIPEGNL